MSLSLVAVKNGEDAEYEFLRIRGHWLYCRKCERPEPEGEDGETLIALADKTKGTTCWLEIMAVGTEVAKPRNWTKKELERRRVPRCLAEYYKTGDIVLVPDHHEWGVKVSPYCDDEFFVDEVVPQAIYREPVDA